MSSEAGEPIPEWLAKALSELPWDEVRVPHLPLRLKEGITEREERIADDAERMRRMRHLLESAAGILDRYMPDGAGARAVLTSQMRDAAADTWDEGEWDEDEGYRQLTNTAR